MGNKLKIGLWRHILNLPPFLLKRQLAAAKIKFAAENGFMSREHRIVHHLVVKELPYAGKPLSPEIIAEKAGMTVGHVKTILDDLQAHMTFLFRNNEGEVVWAYPVTLEKTPHHITFQTGQQLYAA